MTMMMERRMLLATLAALAVTSAGGSFAGAADVATIAGIDAAGAADIGHAWLALHPGDDAKARAELFPDGIAAVRLRHLAQRVRDDFRRDAIFVHRGWFLSVTEARVCALLAAA